MNKNTGVGSYVEVFTSMQGKVSVVLHHVSGTDIWFSCMDRDHAESLAKQMKKCHLNGISINK